MDVMYCKNCGEMIIGNEKVCPKCGEPVHSCLESNDSEVDSAAVGDSSNKVNYYGTQLECIKAVENGTADYTYINNHVALFYNSNYDFKNINIIPQGNLRNQGSYFAINTGVADELLDIINKGIDVVSYSKIEEIIFTNASTSENDVTFFDYVENNQEEKLIQKYKIFQKGADEKWQNSSIPFRDLCTRQCRA